MLLPMIILSYLSYHYVVRSGQGQPGRPARLIHKHVVLALLLHHYASTMEVKNLCEPFGSPLSTTEHVIRHAKLSFEKSLVEIEDEMICWPYEDQQRIWAAWIEAREPPVSRKFGFYRQEKLPYSFTQKPRATKRYLQRLGFTQSS